MVGIFRQSPPKIGRNVKLREPSSSKRGYGGGWKRASRAFRRRNPFCAFCRQSGRLTLVVEGKTGVVDHKWPISDGGPKWDPSNWQPLCTQHHSGLKAMLEEHARKTGQMDQIALWCDEPASRPVFRGDPR